MLLFKAFLRVLSITLLLSLVVYTSYAQERINIELHIKDSLSNPLPSVLVYTQLPGKSSFLATAYTDSLGLVKLTFSSTEPIFILRVRSLGYPPIDWEFPSKDTVLQIQMKEALKILEEVVVKEERQIFRTKGDTTTVDLSLLRDSTERNVEELLSKVPGIDIDANGTISVNGQNIRTILIEDSDMFGRGYTMASKNLRAGYIDDIQIISRYEPNPALKSVNLSEDVVVNLRMKEEFKNIISGNIELGAGFGDELKASLVTNLFFISKKQKYVLLSDNTNVEPNFSPEYLRYMLGSFSYYDVRNSITENFYFLPQEQILNPGIRTSFIDSNPKSFSTLRSDSRLGKRWSFKSNTTLGLSQWQQLQFQTRSLVSDPSQYNLTQNAESQQNFFDAEVELSATRIAENKKGVLENYFRYHRNNTNHQQDLFQIFNDVVEDQFSNKSWNSNNLMAGSLYTRALGEKDVLQFFLKGQWQSSRQNLFGNNKLFPGIFDAPSNFDALSQDMLYDNYSFQASTKWNHIYKLGIIQWEVTATNSDISLNKQDIISDREVEELLNLGRQDLDLTSKQIDNNAQMSIKVNNRVSFIPSMHFRARDVSITDQNTTFHLLNLKLRLQRRVDQDNQMSLEYSHKENAPNLFLSLPFSFYSSNILQQQQIFQQLPIIGNNIRWFGNYNKKYSNIKFNYFADFTFDQKLWNSSINFNEIIETIAPFYSDGNAIFRAGFGYSGFYRKLLMKYSFRPSYSKTFNNILIQNQQSSLSMETVSLMTDVKTRIFRFNLSVENTSSIIINRNSLQNSSDKIYSFASNLGIGRKWLGYQIDVKFQMLNTLSGEFPTANIRGAWVQIEKDFELKETDFRLRLLINNVFNTKTIERNLFSEYFIDNISVQAVAPFFILSSSFNF